MRALVTGGSGFIGSHVVDKLCKRGVTVRIFDMVIPTFRNDVEFYHGSLLDLQALRMATLGVDVIFHLAAIADVNDVLKEPHYAGMINDQGTMNVLEAARIAKTKRVIYGSTTWVYSDVTLPEVDEATPLRAPSHFYTATKIAGEYYCKSYGNLYGLETTILRYGIPYGPRARDAAVVPTFVNKAYHGEPITLQGDGSQYRKFVYVEDLAEGNVLAMKPIAANKTYNLEGNEKITIRQIAEAVKGHLPQTQITFAPARAGDFAGKMISNRLAREELGWEPRTSFKDGLNLYVKWYLNREEERKKDLERLDKELRNS